MSLWSRLFRRRAAPSAEVDERAAVAAPPSPKTVALPDEPFVFECQACGKVFEARRKKAICPECESPDVANMSE